MAKYITLGVTSSDMMDKDVPNMSLSNETDVTPAIPGKDPGILT